MRDNWRKECCRDLMVPCADMNTDILYRILFSTSDCITVCHIWLPVIRKNKWLRFQTVCRYIPLSLKNHNRLVIFVCQRIEWRYIFSTNTGHPLKNTCEMTGTDFSTDGLMRRYVTGGNNQWHTVMVPTYWFSVWWCFWGAPVASVSISCPSCSATEGVVRNGKVTVTVCL